MSHPSPEEIDSLKALGPYPERCYKIYPGPPECDEDIPIATVHGDSEVSERWAQRFADSHEGLQALKERWSKVQDLTREPIQIVVSSDGPKTVWKPAEGTPTTYRIQGMRTTIRELSHIVYVNNLEKLADRLQRVEEERDRLQAEIRAAREGHTELWEGIRDLPERDQDKECTSYLGNLMIRFDTLLADLESTGEDDR